MFSVLKQDAELKKNPNFICRFERILKIIRF